MTEQQWTLISAQVTDRLSREPTITILDDTLRREFGLSDGYYQQMLDFWRRDNPPFSFKPNWTDAVTGDPNAIQFQRRPSTASQ